MQNQAEEDTETGLLEVHQQHVCFFLQIVVTKIDKCGPGALLTNLLTLQNVVKTQTSCCFPQLFLVR